MISRALTVILGAISTEHREEAEALHQAETEKKKPLPPRKDPEIGERPKLVNYQPLTMQAMARDGQIIERKLSVAILNQQVQEEDLLVARDNYTAWLKSRPDIVNNHTTLYRALVLAAVVFVLEYSINIPSSLESNNIEMFYLSDAPRIAVIFSLIQNAVFILLTACLSHFIIKK